MVDDGWVCGWVADGKEGKERKKRKKGSRGTENERSRIKMERERKDEGREKARRLQSLGRGARLFFRAEALSRLRESHYLR